MLFTLYQAVTGVSDNAAPLVSAGTLLVISQNVRHITTLRSCDPIDNVYDVK